MLMLAGVAGLIWPSDAVTAATGWGTYVWAMLLVIGGFAGCWGIVTDRWIGEYIGAPGLCFAFTAYGFAVSFASPFRPSRIAFAFFCFAVVAILLSRFALASNYRRMALNVAQHRQDEE